MIASVENNWCERKNNNLVENKMFDIKEKDVIAYLTGGQGNCFVVYKNGNYGIEPIDAAEDVAVAFAHCPDLDSVSFFMKANTSEYVDLIGDEEYQVKRGLPCEGLILVDRREVVDYIIEYGNLSSYRSILLANLI